MWQQFDRSFIETPLLKGDNNGIDDRYLNVYEVYDADDNFLIICQARSSIHLSGLESVYIRTQNPVLCRQQEFVFSLRLFK